MALIEINNIKNQIKDLFRFNHTYTYDEIYQKIVSSLTSHQKDLFEDKFLSKSLSDLTPINENDFNNFYDTIFDKYSRPGYLIKRSKYFIFQPFDQNEDSPMYYRNKMNINYENQIPIENYVKINPLFKKIKGKNLDKDDESELTDNENQKDGVKKTKDKGYDFDQTMSYYMNRDENFIVGIIDKNLNKLASEDDDLFKIRPPRAKVLEKKRGTGIPTLKGAVCSTSKSKPHLIKLYEKLPKVTKEELDKLKKLTREEICSEIKNKLIFLEKYSKKSENNKITYLMIPIDHPVYKFPLNLEDRLDYLITKLEDLLKLSPGALKLKSDSLSKKIKLTIEELKDDKSKGFYMTINNVNEIGDKISTILEKEGFIYNKSTNTWNINID